ncbi:cysteine hydrolase family protein [Catenisphaera adipataccumulans]|uniref:Nicotinamidase-related amidase n=1 Tax=Catenisphaera adipataccumulans TaxID=700500 RepID=A0A7W8CXV7_9FIRM|nr:isochorismatase family cysteine hydrolase [Catenisphaera adipataccumulans]MBB5182267.1 nicotinamidase-related amidase [Catenisphaera adipataccumulans]
MARLKQDTWQPLAIDEIKDPIIFVVDMVNGFVKEGALHDQEIARLIPAQQAVLKTLACRNVFVCDSHPPRTREFESYPPHCMIGTKEAEVVDELQPLIKYVLRKNSTNTFTAPAFEEYLDGGLDAYQDVIIMGCCTDLCILQFALSLQAWLNEHNKSGMRVIVPVDCVDTFDSPEHSAMFWNDAALQNMAANGICVVSSIK